MSRMTKTLTFKLEVFRKRFEIGFTENFGHVNKYCPLVERTKTKEIAIVS